MFLRPRKRERSYQGGGVVGVGGGGGLNLCIRGTNRETDDPMRKRCRCVTEGFKLDEEGDNNNNNGKVLYSAILHN